MIKFFRKIRQKLLSEGKTGKYLKYAFGEIFLVVIGILIALSINNWNENRKDRKQEQELLIQLESEFESNLRQLDEKIGLRERMISNSLQLIKCIDYPSTCNGEDILRNISISIIAPTFDPIINDIISSGRIQLIKDIELKQKLSLWTSEIIQVTEEEQMWTHYRSTEYVPFLLEQGLERNVNNEFWSKNTSELFQLDNQSANDFRIGKSKKEIDYDKLMNDIKFEGLVTQSASFAKLANSQSLSLRNRIAEILKIIRREIKR